MRTTVNLDDDVLAAISRLRAERGIGLSEAVNELVRSGLTVPRQRTRFVQLTVPVGARLDGHKIAETLERLDGPDWR